MVRVLIVDDSAFMRRTLTALLSKSPDIEVVGVAVNGEDALEKCKELDPDVVTMDIEMPKMDGLTALKHIMRDNPLPVLMISSLTHEGAAVTFEALEEGALGYVTKVSSTSLPDMEGFAAELIETIKAIARRKSLLRLRIRNKQLAEQRSTGSTNQISSANQTNPNLANRAGHIGQTGTTPAGTSTAGTRGALGSGMTGLAGGTARTGSALSASRTGSSLATPNSRLAASRASSSLPVSPVSPVSPTSPTSPTTRLSGGGSGTATNAGSGSGSVSGSGSHATSGRSSGASSALGLGASSATARLRTSSTANSSGMGLSGTGSFGTGSPSGARSAGATPPTGLNITPRKGYDLLVVGVSTGGPPAVQKILLELPANLSVPVLIAQHMPASFTGPFAKRLDSLVGLTVKEADAEERLMPGTVYVCPGGKHFRVENRKGMITALVTEEPKDALYKPSVNVLFETAGEVLGKRVLGVMLTGMGYDGLEGSKVLKAKGGTLLAQSEATCVVYGMPKAVVDAGLSDGIIDIDDMASTILRFL